MAMSAIVPGQPGSHTTQQLRARSSLRDAAIALLLAIVSFLVFNANGRLIPAADTYAARYLPFSILHNHSVLLDPIAGVVAQGRTAPPAQGEGGTAFWISRGRDGHLVSKYPLVVPLAVSPLYVPAVLYLDSIDWDPHVFDTLLVECEPGLVMAKAVTPRPICARSATSMSASRSTRRRRAPTSRRSGTGSRPPAPRCRRSPSSPPASTA